MLEEGCAGEELQERRVLEESCAEEELQRRRVLEESCAGEELQRRRVLEEGCQIGAGSEEIAAINQIGWISWEEKKRKRTLPAACPRQTPPRTCVFQGK